jgi:putative phosphoribosyl transferase
LRYFNAGLADRRERLAVVSVEEASMSLPFADRIEAGRLLGGALVHYAGRSDVIILGLPRGGVPVAFEVARSTNAPLDLMLVRKLGTPGQPELAMGAIATGGVRVLNPEIVSAIRLPEAEIDAVEERERQELERRERLYRGDRPRPEVSGRCVILVDDGLATGATMRVAVTALRSRGPERIVVAVPVAPPDTVGVLEREADEVVCLETPEPFMGVGRWYRSFPQVSDDEVADYLSLAWERGAR